MVMPLSGQSEHWCIVLVVVERDGSLVLLAEPRGALGLMEGLFL